jgi:hypothetical protein
MECSVCKVRSQIGFCKSCERLLCEVCGIPCDHCRKLICRNHRETTPGGRNLCPQCMADRNARRARKLAERQQDERKQAEQKESFSFEALMADVEDAPTYATSGQSGGEQAAPKGLLDATDLLEDLLPPERKRPEVEDNLNTRVLAVSGAQPTPYWNISLRASLLAFVMVLAMRFFSGSLSDWMLGLVGVVALAGLAIGAAGALQKQASATERKLCAFGISLALLTLILGGFWRTS